MRKYAVVLTFLLVVSGCGGSSDTATPATTVAPAVTQAPTATAAPTTVAVTTTAAPTTTVAPTTTSVPATTAAPTTTVTPTTTSVPATTAVATTTTGVIESAVADNLFAAATGDLRSCFLQMLGPVAFEELVNGRQPTPDEGVRFGPCMGASGPPSRDDSTSQSAGQPLNLFASASPELRNCIIQAVGQETFERLAQGGVPAHRGGGCSVRTVHGTVRTWFRGR